LSIFLLDFYVRFETIHFLDYIQIVHNFFPIGFVNYNVNILVLVLALVSTPAQVFAFVATLLQKSTCVDNFFVQLYTQDGVQFVLLDLHVFADLGLHAYLLQILTHIAFDAVDQLLFIGVFVIEVTLDVLYFGETHEAVATSLFEGGFFR